MSAASDHWESLDEISRHVDGHGGIVTLPMWAVRDAYGAARLGVQVRANISDELGNRGVDHMPKELPDNQNASVRLWKRNSPVGKFIRAGRTLGDEHDEALRAAAANDAQNILRKVRELVCD